MLSEETMKLDNDYTQEMFYTFESFIPDHESPLLKDMNQLFTLMGTQLRNFFRWIWIE